MSRPSLLYRFTLFMTVLYALLGLFFIISPDMQAFLPGWKHIVLGLMLIVYSFIRYKRMQAIRKNMEKTDKI